MIVFVVPNPRPFVRKVLAKEETDPTVCPSPLFPWLDTAIGSRVRVKGVRPGIKQYTCG